MHRDRFLAGSLPLPIRPASRTCLDLADLRAGRADASIHRTSSPDLIGGFTQPLHGSLAEAEACRRLEIRYRAALARGGFTLFPGREPVALD